MTTITVSTGVPIQLGYQYDDYATEVVFPASIIEPFTTTYGSGGTFAIWYRRSGDATGYPIGNPLVVFDGSANTVTWTVVETDVANPGQAQVQLRYIKDEHCVMSQMFTAIVEDSVDIGTEIPEPMEQWADAIIKAGSGGQPTAVTSSSSMTNHSAIYLYMGNESGYQYGHIYYWDGTAWDDGGAYGSNTPGSGLTEDVKQALLDCFANVAWIGDDGQDYVDALELALYPPAELVSITATYTQSGTVYDTDTLDSLKADLVVTANYDNGTSAVVTTYTLSGTLTEGTSTITVSYGGKTATFNVVVTHASASHTVTLSSIADSSLDGKYFNGNGLPNQSRSGYHVSIYVEIAEGTSITFSNRLTYKDLASCDLVWYDSSKAILQTVNISTTSWETFTAPENAVYFRVAFADQDLNYTVTYYY